MRAQARRNKNGKQPTIGQSVAQERTSNREVLLNENTVPDCAPNDVICGRGKSSLQHPGNKVYQCKWIAFSTSTNLTTCSCCSASGIINRYAEFYQDVELPVAEKRRMQGEIMNQIESNGGRFLKPDRDGYGWSILPFEVKRQKVAHALQYRVRELRKQQLSTEPVTMTADKKRINEPYPNLIREQNPFDASWELEGEFIPVSAVLLPQESHQFDLVDAGYHVLSSSDSDNDSLEQDFINKALE